MTDVLFDQTQLDAPPRLIATLVSLFCFFTAAPLYDVPLVGISITAPLAGILVYSVLQHWRGFKFEQHEGFFQVLLVLFAAMVFSWFWNALDGALPQFAFSIKTLIRYVFWFLCAMLACRLFSRTTLPEKGARAFALAMIVMSLFVLAEYLWFGGLTHSGLSRLTTLSQNSYGIQYSTFLPLVYYAFVTSHKRRRLFWSVGLVLCLFAALVLGSRTAWGTTLFGLGLFSALYGIVLRKFSRILVLVIFGCLMTLTGWQLIPAPTKATLLHEYDSLERLDRDKSWQIRLLQIQKSQKIFMEKPFLGVGPGQFSKTFVELDIPTVLRYGGSANFSSRSAHNTYVQLLSEGGLVFAVPFGLMLLWLLFSGLRAAITLARLGELWGLGMISGFVGMSIHFWTLSGLTGTTPWFVYGMIASMIYRVRWLGSFAGDGYYSRSLRT